jgi:hypothetical protein
MWGVGVGPTPPVSRLRTWRNTELLKKTSALMPANWGAVARRRAGGNGGSQGSRRRAGLGGGPQWPCYDTIRRLARMCARPCLALQRPCPAQPVSAPCLLQREERDADEQRAQGGARQRRQPAVAWRVRP